MQVSLDKLLTGTKQDVGRDLLGTMTSAQGLALLAKKDPAAFDRIGEVVLFDGADGPET